MWNKHGQALTIFLFAATIAVAVDTVSRVFTLQHVSVAEATAAVEPMLSPEGSLTLQPSRSRITVQDNPEVIEQVARVVETLDRLPDHFRVHVELLEGGAESPFGSAAEVEANERLKKMFKFAAYRRLGGTVVEGELGNEAQAALGSGYKVSFIARLQTVSPDTPWGMPDPGARIHLRGLTLQHMRPSSNGEQVSQEFLRTNILLSPNQKVYIGAGSSEDSKTGLVLIIHAEDAGSE
jgi:hypothetical protein